MKKLYLIVALTVQSIANALPIITLHNMTDRRVAGWFSDPLGTKTRFELAANATKKVDVVGLAAVKLNFVHSGRGTQKEFEFSGLNAITWKHIYIYENQDGTLNAVTDDATQS